MNGGKNPDGRRVHSGPITNYFRRAEIAGRKTSSFDSCRSPLINNTDKYRFVSGSVVEYLSDRVRAALRR